MISRETIILKALKEGRELNQYDTTNKGITVKLGSKEFTTHTTRLGSAICVLRKQGYPIITNRIPPSNYAVYYMDDNWQDIMLNNKKLVNKLMKKIFRK